MVTLARTFTSKISFFHIIAFLYRNYPPPLLHMIYVDGIFYRCDYAVDFNENSACFSSKIKGKREKVTRRH